MAFSAKTEYRHELKYFVNNADIWALKNRLRFVMKKDNHIGSDGRYRIRSLYFDSLSDQALREKLDGISDRVKFRIRLYNGDTDFIRLEKKLKHNGLTSKDDEQLTKEEAELLIAGKFDWTKDSDRPLLAELFYDMRTKGMRGKTIVDYTREPFIYPYGNVRVTVDSDIRSGLSATDIFNPHLPTFPVLEPGISVLEVKYDEYLPDVIRNLLQIGSRQLTQASKYASCRIYL